MKFSYTMPPCSVFLCATICVVASRPTEAFHQQFTTPARQDRLVSIPSHPVGPKMMIHRRVPSSIPSLQMSDSKNGADGFNMGDLMSRVKDFNMASVTDKFNGSKEELSSVADRVRSSVNVNAVKNRLREIDLGALARSMKDNTLGGGELGTRGELFVAVQALVLGLVLLGDVPFLGDALFDVLLGPVLLIFGLGVVAVAIADLGTSLSPWPVPSDLDNAALKKDGLYQYVRHPLYSGLLAVCFSISIITDSVERLALTALLLYVLSVKADYEEENLITKYGSEYVEYQNGVSGKFFPNEVLEILPWSKKSKK